MLTFEEKIDENLQKKVDQTTFFRREALKKAIKIGRPTRKTESLRYLNLSPYWDINTFETKASSSEIFLTKKNPCLVFVDGVFSLEKSYVGNLPEIYPFSKAMSSYAMVLENRIRKSIQEEISYFALLNAAHHDDGLFIYLPQKFVSKEPIEIVHVLTGSQSHVSTRIHIIASKSAEVSFFQRIEGSSESYNIYTDFSLEENAKVLSCDLFSGNEDNWIFSHVRSTVKRNALFKHLNATKGAKGFRQDIKCVLLEENASADLKGLWNIAKKNTAHTLVRVEHRAPNTKSWQHYRGVLRDLSRASFEGQVYVTSNALLTDAYQLSEQMILDEGACAFSKPNLEIFADDVKASHGATITQLSEEELFYLQTRGLHPLLCKEMLVKGFMSFFIDDISYEKFADEIRGGFDFSS